MQFETQRLIIRPWQPSQDARHAMDIYGDARVMSWASDSGCDTSIRQVQGRLQRYRDHSVCERKGVGSWAVEQKTIGRVIGHVVLMPLPDMKVAKTQRMCGIYDAPIKTEKLPATNFIEIGWQFRPSSWGFGYASEAAACVVQFAFDELNLPMLLAITLPENKRSVAVMERLGMQRDGMTARYYGGRSMLLYKLLADQARPVEAQSDAADLAN